MPRRAGDEFGQGIDFPVRDRAGDASERFTPIWLTKLRRGGGGATRAAVSRRKSVGGAGVSPFVRKMYFVNVNDTGDDS